MDKTVDIAHREKMKKSLFTIKSERGLIHWMCVITRVGDLDGLGIEKHIRKQKELDLVMKLTACV